MTDPLLVRMTDPLLVPMHLDAMVLSNEAEANEQFQLAQADYGNLADFTAVGPAPFADLGTPEAGVHLHWTLPRPLRHAPDGSQGGASWPYVPNRWVVVRIAGGAAAGESIKAWIVASDAPAGTSPFVTSADGVTPQATTIGTTHVMTASLTSADLPTAQQPVLRAVGPGSATFSVFAPGVRDVFALHDDMKRDDGSTIGAGTFTYHVSGWYAAPVTDPLASVEWDGPDEDGVSVDRTFGFAVYLSGAAAPTRMLVSAMSSAVAWTLEGDNPAADNYPSDVPSQVSVAVGNTAIDALAALVRLTADPDTAATTADLLEAFQYGALDAFDQPGSSVVLDRAIRDHWFGASPAGIRWTVVNPEPPGPTALPTPAPAPLTGPQAEALAVLNVAQYEQDRLERLLDGMGWNLYSLWFRQQYAAQNFGVPVITDQAEQDWYTKQLAVQVGDASVPPTGSTRSYLGQVKDVQTRLGSIKSAVADATSSLTNLLDPLTQQIKATNLPEYHAATDPVLLMTGLGRSTQLDPVGNLTCRLLTQAVNQLTIDGTTYGAADLPPLPDPNGLLPDGVSALHTEALLLSAQLFAESVLHDPGMVDEVTAAIAALRPPSPSAPFLPAPGSWEPWVQPWVPVLLDWQVTVVAQPAYAQNHASVLEFQQNQWAFDGTDWQWTGTTDPGAFNFGASSMVLTGRTFVTPQLNFALADQLDTYVNTHKFRDPALEALLEGLDEKLDALRSSDVLSQRLSGVRAQMIQHDLTAATPPAGPVGDALQGQRYQGFPLPYPDPVDYINHPVWDFAPAAGSFVTIDRLEIIDFTGRAVDLTLANGSTAVPRKGVPNENWFYPIAGRGLKSPTQKDPVPYPGQSANPTERMIQLPPRLAQDAQVSFRAIANDLSCADVDLVAGANPVCGWIVPDHLDRSLAVYAPDGTPWGQLYLSKHATGYQVAWQPDPTNPQAPASPGEIPNDYAAAMLGSLYERNDAGAALSDLLLVIDETLWGIEPGGPSKDQDLSVLVGRPLAIVRTEVALKLRGTAAVSQDWWNMFDADWTSWPASQPASLAELDGGIRDLSWPVRLGDPALRDDGLIGYFADAAEGPTGPAASTWDSFAVVNRPAGMASSFLKAIGQDAGYVQVRFTDDRVADPDPALQQAQRLTMFVDPRAAVHAFTGLLPVTSLRLDDRFVTAALQALNYLFRAGPFLTSPDAVRIPRPAERKGSWSWFDEVLGQPVPIQPADGGTRLSQTGSVALEGWLRFKPNEEERAP
jgi:hypothetical protein